MNTPQLECFACMLAATSDRRAVYDLDCESCFGRYLAGPYRATPFDRVAETLRAMVHGRRWPKFDNGSTVASAA